MNVKRNIIAVFLVLFTLGAKAQIEELKKEVALMNKECPIKASETITMLSYTYENGYVVDRVHVNLMLNNDQLKTYFGTEELRTDLLKSLTQLPSTIGFAGKVVAAKAGMKTRYITPAGGEYEIVFSPEEVRRSYEAVLFSNLNKFDAKLLHNAGVNYLDSKEYDKAFPCFQRASEQGYTPSQNNLALCYEQGWGTIQNFLKAELWLKKAYEAGDKDAAINLAGLYVSSRLPKYDKALELLLPLAKEGNKDAQFNLTIAYVHLGRHEEAIELSTNLANKGDHGAESNLGNWYLKGISGFPIDYDKAIYWLERAVKANKKTAKHNLPIAQFEKGEILYKNKEYNEAYQYYMKAASNSDNPIPGAMRKLSACYRYGLGVAKDVATADSYMAKAAEYNDEAAMEILGIK